jgi:hypothetical protein
VLPQQFDDYIWFDRTAVVSPLKARTTPGLPDTYPFVGHPGKQDHNTAAPRLAG